VIDDGISGWAVGNPADVIVLDNIDRAMTVVELSQPLTGFTRGRRSFIRSAPVVLAVAGERGFSYPSPYPAVPRCGIMGARLTTGRVIVASGTVKWFNPTKGYGFVQPSAGGKDVFIHISAVERAGLSTLNEGQNIEYEVVANKGKESAENIKVK
jgi:CspA family cold shock protein